MRGAPRRILPAVTLLFCLGPLASCAMFESSPREVVIIARGMTFVLANDSDTPNPVIPLRAGERIRLVLRNEAPGLLHDLQIPDWNVRLNQTRAGETTDVTFTVPRTVGRYQYLCRPHSEMMKGFVEVTS